MNTRDAAVSRALRTPRAAAIAGVLFALLLTAALVLMRLAARSEPGSAGAWPTDASWTQLVAVALHLVPFAGIAFLWFIGVVRDRIGQHEDRFFATVFLGSGLLFIAMLFVAGGVAAGLLAHAAAARTGAPTEVWGLGRRIAAAVLNTYAMRMAAVFMISTATDRVPDGLHLAVARVFRVRDRLGLAAGYRRHAVGELLFPLWILLLSVDTLVASLKGDHAGSI